MSHASTRMATLVVAVIAYAFCFLSSSALQLPYPLPIKISPPPTSTAAVLTFSVDPLVTVSSSASIEQLDTIITRYQTLMRNKVSALKRGAASSTLSAVVVSVTGSDLVLGPDTDESYTISITTTSSTAVAANVTAKSIYGARHGLESLAQLIETPTGYITTAMPLTIQDQPAFPYRALMIDTGRHYLSLDLIKHAIDGMAAVKLNVLHWHIFDSTSFPVESLAFPELSAKGAYAKSAVYSLTDLRAVVAYARTRGVRIIPELEMPGHGSYSAGKPELSLTSCSDVLDPTKNETYEFLTTFLTEMATVFDDEVMYLGGDEVGFDPKCVWPGSRVCGYHCFDKDPSVAAWMKANGVNSSELLGYFWRQVSTRVLPKLATASQRTVGVWMADTPNGAGGPMHVWPAPHMADLPKGSIANVYQSMATAGPLLDKGIPVVLSVASSEWYLDYHPSFATVYSVRPCDPTNLDCDKYPNRKQFIRGGSVSQWGESVDFGNFDVDVWTGATALAERMWSDLPLLPNASAASTDALSRHHQLSCHWKMWGIQTFTRQVSGGEFVSVKDATLQVCPADWSTIPT